MAYKVLTLINDAYRLAGIVPRSGNASYVQETTGLELLKDLLSLSSTNARLIPYFKSYDLTADVGDNEYFIPNLVEADTVTYILDNVVRIPINIVSRNNFLGSAQITNLTTLPYQTYIEKVLGGANLLVYAIPNADYPIRVNGKFSFSTNIALTDDLSTVFDRFYLVYLRYKLANYLAQAGNNSFPPASMDELQKLEARVTDVAPMDLSVNKLSTLSKGNTGGWAQINIGKGWTP